MHEEDGQADVEQDDHADHDGVGTLEETAAARYGRLHLRVTFSLFGSWLKPAGKSEWNLNSIIKCVSSTIKGVSPPAPPALCRFRCRDLNSRPFVWVLIWVFPQQLWPPRAVVLPWVRA